MIMNILQEDNRLPQKNDNHIDISGWDRYVPTTWFTQICVNHIEEDNNASL